MPQLGQRVATPPTANRQPQIEAAGDGPLSTAGLPVQDWNELGRHVLAEALRRARSELARPVAGASASVTSSHRSETWS